MPEPLWELVQRFCPPTRTQLRVNAAVQQLEGRSYARRSPATPNESAPTVEGLTSAREASSSGWRSPKQEARKVRRLLNRVAHIDQCSENVQVFALVVSPNGTRIVGRDKEAALSALCTVAKDHLTPTANTVVFKNAAEGALAYRTAADRRKRARISGRVPLRPLAANSLNNPRRSRNNGADETSP